MKPAPPVTRIFMEIVSFELRKLLVLRLPIVIDPGIVVGDAPFVLGIVETVGQIDQQGFFAADDFVAVCYAGGNQHLPRAQRADVQGVAQAVRGRTQPQVRQHNLKQTFTGVQQSC